MATGILITPPPQVPSPRYEVRFTFGEDIVMFNAVYCKEGEQDVPISDTQAMCLVIDFLSNFTKSMFSQVEAQNLANKKHVV